jgi:hypothetical protein
MIDKRTYSVSAGCLASASVTGFVTAVEERHRRPGVKEIRRYSGSFDALLRISTATPDLLVS